MPTPQEVLRARDYLDQHPRARKEFVPPHEEIVGDGKEERAEDLDEYYSGAFPSHVAHHLSNEVFPRPSEPERDPLEELLEQTPQTNPGRFVANFKALTRFKEGEKEMRIDKDIIGFLRRRGGTDEPYEVRLQNAEEKGHTEAAAYGISRVGEGENRRRFVLFTTHWDFQLGTIGEVVGEKFARAVELAERRGLPLVAIHSSAGVRQDENTVGLYQMQKMEAVLMQFQEKVKGKRLPYISVLCESWGGLTASVGFGDITLGVRRTRAGFAGPKPIAAYQGTEPSYASQSVEKHYIEGNIDYLVDDPEDLYQWLHRTLRVLGNNEINRRGDETRLRAVSHDFVLERTLPAPGFYSLMKNADVLVKRVPRQEGAVTQEQTLYEQTEALKKNPLRPNIQDFLRYGVSEVVPLYNAWRLPRENVICNRPIIAALGIIGRQTYLIIGNMPTYYETSSGMSKIPSSPDVKSIEQLVEWYELGNQLGVDCIVMCDTFGAKPTEREEHLGVAKWIKRGIRAGTGFKNRLYVVVAGMIGSGGGIITAPKSDKFFMSERGFAGAAEPRSMATIVYPREPVITQELLELTVNTMRGTAKDQVQLEVADKVIPEPVGGAQASPGEWIDTVRHMIVRESGELNRSSINDIFQKRFSNIRHFMPIPLRGAKKKKST